ncbi:MAG: hypothetical protein HKN80_11420 [Acidimicrobiia bacterium]|nr:hypothetical protein [Acidimicrobiia bacterium]
MSLITNGVSWYLRSRLTVDRGQIEGTTPRTILGLVPVGKSRFIIDLSDLTDVRIATKLNPDRMIVATILGLAAVLGGFGPVATLLCTVGAIAFLLLGFIAVVRLAARDQPVVAVPVCLANLGRARRFISDVELRTIAAPHPPAARPADD